MTLKRLESVQQLRYSGLCNVLPIWTIWAIRRRMSIYDTCTSGNGRTPGIPQLALARAHA